MLLPTTLVGSYPQPDWLIDRASLAKQMPPRVRARDLWRVDARAARSRAGRRDAARHPRPGARRPRHRHRRRAAARELFQPLRHRARRRRYRQSRQDAEPHRRLRHRAAHRRPDPAQASGRGARRAVPARQYRPHDQDDGAGPVHHGAAVRGPVLPRRGGARARLRGGAQRRDQGSVRGRRRRGAARRSLDAGAAREGASAMASRRSTARSMASRARPPCTCASAMRRW